ncbi:protein Njmu-R1 isoform X2 [Clarias magur]|uniref:Protein Njmu-R1 isoform X2 n=1 Tax=Clarias magur TaxID=1594786 RepID=A0A8J4WS36_CLAMG|nr:protein Njmu-R1 isoform X2 [Clarias magur]
MQNLESEVRPYLSRWYEESVMHIHRVVQLVQANISFLLHAALSHTHVEVTGADERTKTDVGCGNGDVLLQNARAEHSGLPEACSIIRVLEEFLSEQAVITAQ